MSFWSYVHGTITVEPMGRTQHEKRYILETVLDHLPRVIGSEGDMNVYVIQRNGYDSSSSHDEFGERTNNAKDYYYGGKSRKHGMYRVQSGYILVVDGDLRDCLFKNTFKEFMKWICRLSKRVQVLRVAVNIDAADGKILINDSNKFYKMYEDPSWCREDGDTGVNWCEYLLWERCKDSSYPMALAYKYFDDPENDEEYERRMKYDRPWMDKS